MQCSIENVTPMLYRWIALMRYSARAVPQEICKITHLILQSTSRAMIKNMFQAIEALFRAVIYLLILLMGLSMAGLGAFTIFFLAIRIGQFLWALIFVEKWI